MIHLSECKILSAFMYVTKQNVKKERAVKEGRNERG